MPKVKEPTALKAVETEPITEWLEDGHPNPQFFPKDGEGFEAFQAALEERNLWGDYFGKLYRIAPLRSLTDKPPRVCKFASTLTLQQIEKTWGGKKWSVYLSRRVGTRDRMIGVFQFNIEARAVYQDGEEPEPAAGASGKPGESLAGNSKGDPMVVRLMEDLIAQRDRAAQEGKAFNVGDALENALSLQNQGFSSALTAITANVGKQDNAAISSLTSLVTELIKANSARKEDPIMQALLTKALEKSEPPQNPFEQILSLLTLLKELGIKIGGGSRVVAEPGSEWAGVVEKGLDKLPDFLNGIGALAAQQRVLVQPPPRAIPPPDSATAPVAGTSVSSTTGPIPVPTANPAGKPAEPTPYRAWPEISPELADVMTQNVVKGVIVRMLFEGEPGDEAAHYAELAHEALARQLAGILKTNPAALREDPILAHALSHPNAMQFAKDFVGYFEEEAGAPVTTTPIPIRTDAGSPEVSGAPPA